MLSPLSLPLDNSVCISNMQEYLSIHEVLCLIMLNQLTVILYIIFDVYTNLILISTVDIEMKS